MDNLILKPYYRNSVGSITNNHAVIALQNLIDEKAIKLFEMFINSRGKFLLLQNGNIEDLENYVAEYNKLYAASEAAKKRIQKRKFEEI